MSDVRFCECHTLKSFLFTLSEGSRTCMQRQFRLGGGVAPKTTLLRGQSIIEYVLIAAIIGLVVVFAGPQVSSAIRNQFNQVTNTVDSGTDGDSFMSAEEKAYREAMKTVAQKDAKDWTLDEQKAVADDIAKNGTSSVVYGKVKAAMDAGTTWSVKLTNGETMNYRIIGINHDDLADSSGKTGLTFEATNDVMDRPIYNTTDTNAGGWEKSELRGRLNSGDLWALLPSELQSKVKAVTKITDNKGGGSAGVPSATTDNIFLLSSTEVMGDLDGDGSQYEYYKSKGVTKSSYSGASSSIAHWLRSVHPGFSTAFRYILKTGDCSRSCLASGRGPVFPAWCF